MLIHRRLLRILDSRRTDPREIIDPWPRSRLVAMALVVLPYGRVRDAAAEPGSKSRTLVRSESRPPPTSPASSRSKPSFLHDDRASSAEPAPVAGPGGRLLARRQDTWPPPARIRTDRRPRPEQRAQIRAPARRPRRRRDLPGLQPRRLDPGLRRLRHGPSGLWDLATGRLRSGATAGSFPVGLRDCLQPPTAGPSPRPARTRTIRLWDVASSGQSIATRSTGPTSAIRALAFSPDGRTLASAGADRVATLWDLVRQGLTRSARPGRSQGDDPRPRLQLPTAGPSPPPARKARSSSGILKTRAASGPA